jgi:hypothetical protein
VPESLSDGGSTGEIRTSLRDAGLFLNIEI